ncbi:exosome non-catalytic core subunit RRP4 ASCRUDRAFT_77003 [Ascoidea rubescens DSM 1968]|uniref:Uncharacterized protein n=1 Tax=Ascoidea rubescens DSM 1968 TaxID=1344418 RepID=A0A1D2VDE2_9ASCO|nr:hypothetical protein ASCRUDRAFT_77003 [Ascoidea rubescens DSM 1968]ODV59656.1 hypothetical protein ASCRUDRAFT_77003 [Ascoidea rubescens DSM 1968]
MSSTSKQNWAISDCDAHFCDVLVMLKIFVPFHCYGWSSQKCWGAEEETAGEAGKAGEAGEAPAEATMEVLTVSKPIQNREDFDSDSDSDLDLDFASPQKQSLQNSVVTPGELVTSDPMLMRGHGTYSVGNKTYSSVAGTISRVNKLLSVIPLKSRFRPETGDHIVGRITEVGNKRWKVDIGGEQNAILLLGSVNLPGGILRRKSQNDELTMRNFLKEGDLLNCEVQMLYNDGAAGLHTRSLKYGKLRNGLLVLVPSYLIVRTKNHSFDLPGNVSIILGVNGFVWLYKTPLKTSLSSSSTLKNTNLNKFQTMLNSDSSNYTPGSTSVSITRLEEESTWEIYSDKNDPNISNNVRLNIVRYKNCLKCLSHCEIGITKSRIEHVYDISLEYENSGNLIEIEVMERIGKDVLNGEKMRGVNTSKMMSL